MNASIAAPHLRVVADEHDEIPLGTGLWRHHAGMPDDEPTEVSIFVHGRPFVLHAMTAADHLRGLQQAGTARRLRRLYVPVNGPFIGGIFHRYPRNQIIRWAKKRVTDKDVKLVRSVYIDFDVDDPERVSGISATEAEVEATRGPATECKQWLTEALGREPIGFGSSGNGFCILIAVVPFAPTSETTQRIAGFLATMNKRFGRPGVKVDTTTANPAQLMPCAGTLKAKGIDSPERPHRRTTFICHPRIVRVPLEAIC